MCSSDLVAGVREKIQAAGSVGAKTVVFPAKNRVDLENLRDEIRGDLEVVLAESVEEVLDLILC